jgi:hypothetical protein
MKGRTVTESMARASLTRALTTLGALLLVTGAGACGTSKAGYTPPPPPPPDAGAGDDGGVVSLDDAAPPPSCTSSAPFAPTLQPLDIFFVVGMPELVALGQGVGGGALNPLFTYTGFTNTEATLDVYPNFSGNTVPTEACGYQSYTGSLYPWSPLPSQGGNLENEVAAAYTAYAVRDYSELGSYIADVPSSALQGTLLQATAWKDAHADHFVAVVLVTDIPQPLCPNQLAEDQGPAGMRALAQEAHGYDGVATFFGATSPGDALALQPAGIAGGGTTVDLTSGGGITALEDAIAQARRAAVLCDFTIPSPDGGTVDPKEVNVQANQVFVPQVPNAAACPNAGRAWYYDSSTDPTHIMLCPALCQEVEQNPSLAVEVLFGCPTIGVNQ